MAIPFAKFFTLKWCILTCKIAQLFGGIGISNYLAISLFSLVLKAI